MENNTKAKFEDSIEVKCRYEDIFGEKISEVFKLNFKDSFAAGKLTPPDTYIGQISYRLEKIEKLFNNLINQKNDI